MNSIRKLAELQPAGELKKLLSKLAQEELAHKEKAEYLYCNAAFPQTDWGINQVQISDCKNALEARRAQSKIRKQKSEERSKNFLI